MKMQGEIRRSERFRNDITVTTKEKNERMARKRNLEGNPLLPTCVLIFLWNLSVVFLLIWVLQ